MLQFDEEGPLSPAHPQAGRDHGQQGEQGEKNPYLKAAISFMRSGATIRRAHRRPLQFLDRGAHVKFTDVAGLGNIRVELEEIVNFFTMGEIYRRRGVRVPGESCPAS